MKFPFRSAAFLLSGLSLALVLSLIGPAVAHGAELYFTPAQATYPPGGTVSLDLRLNNQDECVNAAEVNVSYPKNLMDVVDISRGNSIFSIWLSPPTIRPDLGLITMVGGVPGGYCGRTPGDPSLTNVVATLIFRFKPLKTGAAPTHARVVVLDSSKVALNDGRGTAAKLVPRAADFTIDANARQQKNIWTDAIAQDKLPPDAFAIEVLRDSSVFEGQYFAVFSTVDKQTGIDHYELLETKDRKDLDNKDVVWRHVDSPVVLTDQSLKSSIFVRAVDKAGNAQTTEYTPSQQDGGTRRLAWWFAGLALVVVALASILRFLPL